MIVEKIASPADVKRLERPEIETLACEIREMLVETCAVNGGHLAPNLGVVELTLALHRVLDLPHDKLVWDVSHQTYVHKILTGRRDRFGTIRKGGGISGFAMRSESEYDPFGAGHASTAVSAALGMAHARDLTGGDETVVAVIGDGALTGGLAYEALNNAGALKSQFIVILNDNEMSIAPNVGSIASYLSVLRTKPFANFGAAHRKDGARPHSARRRGEESDRVGRNRSDAVYLATEKTAVIFEELGFRYIGPVDGHNFDAVVDALAPRQAFDRPVLLHVRTVKGKGYEPAERDSRTFHGVGANAFEPRRRLEEEQSRRASEVSRRLRRCDDRRRGTRSARRRHHGRHARRHRAVEVWKAFSGAVFRRGHRGGARGLFCRRARRKRPAPGLRDLFDLLAASLRSNRPRRRRAESSRRFLHGSRGLRRRRRADAHGTVRHRVSSYAPERHPHGAALRRRTPADARARAHAERTCRASLSAGIEQRAQNGETVAPIAHGKAEVLRRGSGVAILAYGTAVDLALDAYDKLQAAGYADLPTVVNARFAKPLDEALLAELERDHDRVITLEEHSVAGGFGSAVAECVSDRGLNLAVERVGVPNVLVQHDSQEKQRAMFGLTAAAIAERVAASVPLQAVSR